MTNIASVVILLVNSRWAAFIDTLSFHKGCHGCCEQMCFCSFKMLPYYLVLEYVDLLITWDNLVSHWLYFYFLGACWPSLRSPESAELLLGGWGLHLQVLWGDSDRPLPQGHQTQPRHPMDHKGCAQAQRDAWPDICRQEEPRPGQGPQVPSDHRRLPPCSLEEAQHPAAAPLSLVHANCLYIQKIKILFMVTVLSRVHSGVRIFVLTELALFGCLTAHRPYSDWQTKAVFWHRLILECLISRKKKIGSNPHLELVLNGI